MIDVKDTQNIASAQPFKTLSKARALVVLSRMLEGDVFLAFKRLRKKPMHLPEKPEIEKGRSGEKRTIRKERQTQYVITLKSNSQTMVGVDEGETCYPVTTAIIDYVATKEGVGWRLEEVGFHRTESSVPNPYWCYWLDVLDQADGHVTVDNGYLVVTNRDALAVRVRDLIMARDSSQAAS